MPKLSKKVLEWTTELGLSPEQVQKNLRIQANTVREIVEQKFTDVLNGDLGVHAGVAGSLKSYKPVSTKVQATDSETGITFDTWDITIESEQHKSIVSRGHALNVFNLLDTGRKQLKKKPKGNGKGKFYTLWSFTGEHTVGYKPKGRGLRNKKTGKFGLTTGASVTSQTPIRHEPRLQKQPYAEKSATRESAFFVKGPIAAIAPKNLYERIFQSAQKEIKRRKLIYNIVLVKGKR